MGKFAFQIGHVPRWGKTLLVIQIHMVCCFFLEYTCIYIYIYADQVDGGLCIMQYPAGDELFFHWYLKSQNSVDQLPHKRLA